MIPIERYLNTLIGRCFVNGLIEDYQLLMNFIFQYSDKCKNKMANLLFLNNILKVIFNIH